MSVLYKWRKPLLLFCLTGMIYTLFSFSNSNSSFFEISKNLDIFTTLYRELNTYYVDTLNPDKLVHAGIDNMLDALDPYTNYIPEEEVDDYRLQTTGKYGGIGAIIGTRGQWVIVSEPYEGFPAQKSGLLAGDRITEVDGKSAKNYKTDDVSKMLKGKPGTEVTVKIMRKQKDGTETESLVKMIREEIKIKNVPYFGMINDKVGYIRLGNFTEKAGQEVKTALLTLENNHKIKGVVLDLRGNPGGLLNEAINVVNVFVDKNVEVVSTKGKIEEWNKTFYTLNEPVDTKIPVVVLTDGGSASASEIVSGSLQDLDRAVIVGQKTFGKGLVQSTRSLPFNAKLKVTTAKYYIPSGRCIQAINYAKRDDEGEVHKMPDSLKTAFKTKHNRTVYDGVGIDPDISIEPERISQITISLVSKNHLFDYATDYRIQHDRIGAAKDFSISDKEYEDFMNYISSKEYDYTTRTEKLLDNLKETTKREKYYEAISGDLETMQKKLVHDKKQDLLKEKEEIKGFLEAEICTRYYLQAGRVESDFKHDPEIKKALEVLNDESRMKIILKN